MKLTNVARSSLSEELLRDYESFLTQNGLRVWPKDSRAARAMRGRLARDTTNLPCRKGVVRLQGLLGLPDFVSKAAPEIAANAMLCAVNQAAYLLKRQLESQERTFMESGGFTERLYKSRTQARKSDWSDKSDRSDSSDSPLCPRCRKPMQQRKLSEGTVWSCRGCP